MPKFQYVLYLRHNREAIARDDRPELLNYLRLGLPDCLLQVCSVHDSVLTSSTPIAQLVQERLQALKWLDMEMHNMLSPSLLKPTFVPELMPMPDQDYWHRLVQYQGGDADTIARHWDLLRENQRDLVMKCQIFFEIWAPRLSNATSKVEINQIIKDIKSRISYSGLNI